MRRPDSDKNNKQPINEAVRWAVSAVTRAALPPGELPFAVPVGMRSKGVLVRVASRREEYLEGFADL